MNYKKVHTKLFIIVLAFSLLFSACSINTVPIVSPTTETQELETPNVSARSAPDTSQVEKDSQPFDPLVSASPNTIEEVLQVIIFDVGQADCVLITVGEHAMLIDAGNVGQESLVLAYLNEYGITKLDYLVATHPHADHIGSMTAVIRAMANIETMLMPDIIHTTKTFEDLLDAIEEKDIDVAIPVSGDTFELGNAKILVLAPNSNSYSDLNNYSIVLRIEYGQSSFLLTGDAEDVSEHEQLATDFILNSDVLKVGHHGSDSSTTQKYLTAVSPSYAVISCGKGNSYGHPDSETVESLKEYGVTLYRTDENGTVTFSTDGNTISANTEREYIAESVTTSTPDNQSNTSNSYIGNKNSKIFHLPSCGSLPLEKNRVYFLQRDDAINDGYRPCKKCFGE